LNAYTKTRKRQGKTQSCAACANILTCRYSSSTEMDTVGSRPWYVLCLTIQMSECHNLSMPMK